MSEFTPKELKNSKRIIKSQTPKGTADWYIKWFSSILVLIAVAIRSANIPELHYLDVILSCAGSVGWFIVGFMWKDRSLVLLNGVIAIMLCSSLIRMYFGV